MIKHLLALLLTAFCLTVSADESLKYLVVWTKDGTKTTYALKDSPQVKFTKTSLVVTKDGQENAFLIGNLQRFTYESIMPGDVNGDAKVDIVDVTKTISHIFGLLPSGFSEQAADINEDGNVDSDDVAAIANLSLLGSENNKPVSGRQPNGGAFYVYRNDNDFNAFFRDEVEKLEYSNYDADSVYCDEVVTQVVYTPDSIYRIPLAVIDSVGFVTPKEEYKPSVLRMNNNWLDFVIAATDSTVTFKSTTPKIYLPAVGQVIVAETFESPFDTGFAGRVRSVRTYADSLVYETDEVRLSDIYSQLVSIGVAQSEQSPEVATARRIWGMSTNPGVRFPLPDVDVPIGPVTISCEPDVRMKYIVCVIEHNMKDYIDIQVSQTYRGSVKLDCKFDADFKPEPKWIPGFIPITTGIPGLYGKIQFGGFLRASGSAQLSATQPFVISGLTGFKWGEDVETQRINEWSAQLEDTEISLSLDGSVSFGLATRLQFGIVHERIASADVTTYAGFKIDGHLGLSSAGIVDKTLYSAVKDSKITFSFDTEIVPGYRFVGSTEHNELPVSIDLKWPLNHWYGVPEFNNLSWERDESGNSGTLMADINRNLLPKVSLGWGLYDEDDNQYVTPYYFPSTYRKIEDWQQNGLEYHVKDLPYAYGVRLRAYPMVRLMGVEMRADKYVDLTSGVLVRNIGKAVVNGSSATATGYVEGLENGAIVVDAGFCYTSDPSSEQWEFVSAKTKEDGEFSVTLTGLRPQTTYYYCAYAYVDGEYYYADEVLTLSAAFPVSLSNFKVTKSQYQKGAFSHDGQSYDYRFDVSVTAAIDNTEGVSDWGYVYRDPNGRIEEISLRQFGTSYTDTRYAYYRNQAHSTACLYGYVKYSGSDETVYGELHDYPLDYQGGETSCPDANHPHMIDLGLPSGTKWACCNVGASAPEQYGNYYAWGETQTKNVYNWDTDQYYQYDNSWVDIGSDIAGTRYDAATVNWGAPWRMPSVTQIVELSKCSSTWTTQNGVYGRKFTGPNGGTVFLPAAGRRWDSELSDAGYGLYWSSTLNESSLNDNSPDYAFYLLFNSSFAVRYYDGDRSSGRSVRPVR